MFQFPYRSVVQKERRLHLLLAEVIDGFGHRIHFRRSFEVDDRRGRLIGSRAR